MTYKGRYKVKNYKKYKGDPTKVIYRSSWERAVFRYLDGNEDILEWNSESYVIPYRCRTDNRMHRYFVDIYFKYKNGKKFLVEIKPKYQTVPPKKPKRQTKKYLAEVNTYLKNVSKWEAADRWAKDRGYHFQVWHEDTLRQIGVKILKG
tara:strand:+ start:8289 stop:8735 length:447 start_codon:yes stop_codon:yes gene_type:complete